LTRSFLLRVRGRAFRRGVWYRALDGLERGILSLAARVVDRVESAVLGVELVKILAKLRDALESEVVKLTRGYGLERARSLSRFAVEWGNLEASGWASDHGFRRYLAVLEYYRPSVFGF
jgi:hypothetical protein